MSFAKFALSIAASVVMSDFECFESFDQVGAGFLSNLKLKSSVQNFLWARSGPGRGCGMPGLSILHILRSDTVCQDSACLYLPALRICPSPNQMGNRATSTAGDWKPEFPEKGP